MKLNPEKSGGGAEAAARGVKGEGDPVGSVVGSSERAGEEGLRVEKGLRVVGGELRVAAERC